MKQTQTKSLQDSNFYNLCDRFIHSVIMCEEKGQNIKAGSLQTSKLNYTSRLELKIQYTIQYKYISLLQCELVAA